MEELSVKVCLFGELSVSLGNNTITCSGTRSKKVWNLLAYLFYHRGRSVTSDEITSLLWNNTGESPKNAMKTALHRTRTLLDSLAENLGHKVILFKDGGYYLNPDVEITVDVEEFDSLIRSARDASPDEATDLYLRAISIYKGDFANILSSESWVIPISAYYHNLYVSTVEKIVPKLEEAKRFKDGIDVAKAALRVDPYHEHFYQLLMRCLLQIGARDEVVTVYEEMSKLLLSTFGVMPDKESRSMYREALKTVNISTVSPDAVKEQLTEIGNISGALLCDYDFFRMMYQAKARMIARTGDAIHIALLTLQSRTKSDIAPKSIEIAMDNLEKHLCTSLRKGDLIARCSVSQFVIMLPQANYENSCAVCQRFIDSFERKYPHSPLKINYFVHSVTPSTDN